MSAEAAAREILGRHWDRVLPVDPVKLTVAAGLVVYGRGGQGDADYPYSGRYSRHEGRPFVEYNVTEVLVRQRFIVAHELGHFVLGHQDVKADSGLVFASQDEQDVQANRFAAELLLPSSVLRHHYESGEAQSVAQLAQTFGVSTDAMGFRLRDVLLPAPKH